MKSTIILVFGLSLFGCSEDKLDNKFAETLTSNGIVGTWRLTEVLADPGDGSGVFQEVERNKSITFIADGTFTATEQFCNNAQYQEDNGTYDLKNGSISPASCQSISTSYHITFEMSEHVLILNFPCIEPCAEKYVKTQVN